MSGRSIFGSIKKGFSSKSAESASSSSRNPFEASKPAGNSEPPPAYTPTAPPSNPPAAKAGLQPSGYARGASPSPSIASVTNDNDKYAFLATFDTIFLVDDSGSMAGSNWRETDAALRSIAPICTSHDKDGVDIYFLNHRSSAPASSDGPAGGYTNVTSEAKVKQIFDGVRPNYTTPTGTRLESILKPYIAKYERAASRNPADPGVKPINIIVITDGVPTDDPEGVIVQYARKLDKIEAPPYQVGIQFFQVGTEPEAGAALAELDDELSSQGVRDIVDTVSWDASGGSRNVLTADGILKVVLGAVVRRLDRKSVSRDARSRT